MKYHGSKFEFEQQRNEDLMRAYHKLAGEVRHLSLDRICKQVVNMPAQRFWVSEERAAVVIAAIMNGDDLSYMRTNKREMFMEIYKRAMAIRRRMPNTSILQIASIVVNQKAPKFYLTPGSAKVYICSIKKIWYKQRKQKILHLE